MFSFVCSVLRLELLLCLLAIDAFVLDFQQQTLESSFFLA